MICCCICNLRALSSDAVAERQDASLRELCLLVVRK